MLQIQELYYAIGEHRLLSGANWALQPGQRAALIGPNGAGKTTLLRLITGELEAQSGTIVKPKNYRIGYLPQEEIPPEDGSVLQSVIIGRQDIVNLGDNIREIQNNLASTSGPDETLLTKLGEMEHRFAASGGYELESLVKSILSGLGFPEADFNRPLREFSGGWCMRAYLARLLVQKPDLLLLDEPTNHLDLPSLEWLEQYLLGFTGSMILVSHDRFFIDRLAQIIYELDRGRLDPYPGNYAFFEQKKALKEDLLRKKWEEQQAERKRQELFIERFRYKATKAAQVQSRIKQLEKMEKIELPPERRRFNFVIKVDTKSYKDVVQLQDLFFRYADNWILEDLNMHILRGDRVALVGANGAGKTTLTRLLAGELIPQSGNLFRGQRVKIGYYAQHQLDALNMEATVYEEAAALTADDLIPKVRDVLGIFQFSGDDVQKKIKVLSGGEKARVSLAKILLSPANFLIMDEPTNHLDIISREALEQALQDYDGTLLLISHDRYFLDKLIGRVFELKDRHLEEYAGNYSYYLEKRIVAAAEVRPEKLEKISTGGGKKTREQKRAEAMARQAISKERNLLEQKVAELEDQIESLETRKTDIEKSLCLPEILQDGTKIAALQKELFVINQELPLLFLNWEKLRLELEEVLNSL